jgi:DNA-binding transcriptional MerR regulator
MTITYSISDLAREFDLTTRAIRFYEDLGLLEPERSGLGGRSRIYSGRDRTRLKLTLRAKRLGLSLTEAKEIIDMYDSPRDTGAQLQKYLDVLALHREQVEAHMLDMQSNLDELKTQEKEARALLAKAHKATKESGAPNAAIPAKVIKAATKAAKKPKA